MLPKKSSQQLTNNHYSTSEEWLNVFTHTTGFVLSVFGIVAMVTKAKDFDSAVVLTIYGVSLALMFLSSSLYHALSKTSYAKTLRTIDHIAIYLLIAGSYTPFLLLGVGSTTAKIGLAIVWAVGILGIVFKLIWGSKYPKLSVATYAIMGWLALFLIYPIYQSLSGVGFTLLVAGGLAYSAGIPLYMLKSRHYTHALWHVCVLAGAACHFFSVYLYVI